MGDDEEMSTILPTTVCCLFSRDSASTIIRRFVSKICDSLKYPMAKTACPGVIFSRVVLFRLVSIKTVS